MRGFLTFIFDALFPARCLVCGALTERVPGADGVVIPDGWPSETYEFLVRGPAAAAGPITRGPAVAAEMIVYGPGAPEGLTACGPPTPEGQTACGPPTPEGQTACVPAAAGALDASTEILCAGCWMRLIPAAPETILSAAGCGLRLPVTAPFVANETLLTVIRFLKFEGGRRAAAPLGWWMAAALGRTRRVPDGAVLVPVPLHGTRRALRGYNQAELLAVAVSRATGLPLRLALLRRIRSTRPQSKLDAAKRADNVRGAFKARPGAGETLRHVILVDDLVTTGETVVACAAALQGAAPVSISVLAAGAARDRQ